MSEKRFAVLVGNGTYGTKSKFSKLRCPVNDAEGLGRVLRDPKRGYFDETVVLKDKPAHEILRHIQQALNDAGTDDLVFIYYSGHGKLNRAGELHLAAADTELGVLEATSVPVSSIRNYVTVSSCRRVVLVLDCCYAGAGGNAFTTKGDVDDQLQLAAKGRGTYIITASTAIQTSLEKGDDQYSVFTKHLIDGLDSGEADRNADGFVTIDELYDHLQEAVTNDSHQEPRKWSLDVRGDLVVARSGREPRKERGEAIRRLLLKLAGEHRITNEILTAALHIVDSLREKLSDGDRLRDDLLEQLYKMEDITPAEFAVRWGELKSARGTATPEIAAVEKEADSADAPSENPRQPRKTEYPKTSEPVVDVHQHTIRPDRTWWRVFLIAGVWSSLMGVLALPESVYDFNVPWQIRIVALAGFISTLVSSLILQRLNPRIRWRRIVAISITWPFGWLLAASDWGLALVPIGFTVCATGPAIMLLWPKSILPWKSAALSGAGLCVAFIGGYFLAGFFHGAFYGLVGFPLWGFVLGAGGWGPLAFLVERAGRMERAKNIPSHGAARTEPGYRGTG